MTKRDGQPNKNHLARIEADKRRRHVMNLHDHSGLTFKEIGKLLGFSATRASQMYYMGQWRSDEWRKREDAARRWKSIASDMVTELDLREAFRRELEQDRASRNAAMPKQQTKPYDVIPHCLERVISG